jgi:pyruvate formate lyase activating enzyme
MTFLDSASGFLPNSMLDWPGKVCTVLFLNGCNFRCPYCHNPDLVNGARIPNQVSWNRLAFFLTQRKGWIDGVSISGGEPTLHAELPELCRKIKSIGMLVKIDTNGSRPRMLREMLARGLIDHISMDIKTSLPKYPEVVRRPVDMDSIVESMKIILKCGIEHEFRCTVVPGLVKYKDLESIARMLEGAEAFVLQQFRHEKTLEPSFQDIKPYPDDLLSHWAERLSSITNTHTRGLTAMAGAH